MANDASSTPNGTTIELTDDAIAQAKEILRQKRAADRAASSKETGPNGPHVFLRALADALAHVDETVTDDAVFRAWIMKLQPRFDMVADFDNLTTSGDFKNLATSVEKSRSGLPVA
jgi:hypothetical protein